ncbi:hypothetical protein XO12_05675 [Marinitoga sp. 1154]|uniref:hypothetical protein n=1 Tax=Marinitoga sp. 1154 TaxID=1643335 RepID=UPI00158667DF|nr:hypothetical protein [Marinitoga sp. 1154]NUU99607.1 hypothetical protein [Marinitoga sp. 1154]
MKKITLIIFILYSLIILSYQIKIDYINNKNIIEVTGVSTDTRIFQNNTKTDYKIQFKNVKFEEKEYILPKGPIKLIKQYDNIIEIIMLFPTQLNIDKTNIDKTNIDKTNIETSNKIKITAEGKKRLNDEIFQFKKIKAKDLLEILLKELGFNQYYLTEIPDKDISLNIKNFYPEDLFRLIIDSTGIYYNYIGKNNIYISKNPLYKINYPIINSKYENNEDLYEVMQTDINISSLMELIDIQYTRIYEGLYILKGDKNKIEMIKKIIAKIPVKKTMPEETKKLIVEKEKIYKVFEYKIPQKNIIKLFNIEYTEISDNIILLKGFKEDIKLFEEYYFQAYTLYEKQKTLKEKVLQQKNEKQKIGKSNKTDIKPMDLQQMESQATITVMKTKLPIEKLSNILNLEINKLTDEIYIIKGKNNNIDILSNIISKIPQPQVNKINKKNNIKNIETDEKIEIIESNLDLYPFNKIFKNVIIQKIEKNYIIKGTPQAINTIKEFNEKYNIALTNDATKNNITNKIITDSATVTNDYYIAIKNDEIEYFEKISKSINITYKIIYENETGKIIKITANEKQNEKFKKIWALKEKIKEEKTIKKTETIDKNNINSNNKNKIEEYETLYKLVENYALKNNISLINNEKLKDIKIYNNKVQNIEDLLLKNGYYIEKGKDIIIVKEKIPEIISIEIAIVDSSVLEETIKNIESKISSKSIIDSINQGIINPQLYKEILDTAIKTKNIDSKTNTKLVSKPRIILKSGTKAIFKSVYRIPVIQENSIKYIESGLNLEISGKYIENKDLIDLDISLKVGEPEKSSVSNYNAENSREINTKMILKNNYVSIIGGLKIMKEEKLNSGIPLLKDLPIIGFLFKTNEQRNREYDLNLFIWPKTVNYGGD